MFQFPGLPSHRLCIYLWILKHYLKCVPAFGNLRINGYLLLPAAYRSLSRPSSAPGAKASALCSLLLDLLLVFCSLHCVAARSFVGYIPKYAPSALPRAPCESSKILRNLHCRILFKTNAFQIPTLALCVGFFTTVLLVVKIFWFLGLTLKLYPYSPFLMNFRTHKILKKHSCDLSRFRFRC